MLKTTPQIQQHINQTNFRNTILKDKNSLSQFLHWSLNESTGLNPAYVSLEMNFDSPISVYGNQRSLVLQDIVPPFYEPLHFLMPFHVQWRPQLTCTSLYQRWRDDWIYEGHLFFWGIFILFIMLLFSFSTILKDTKNIFCNFLRIFFFLVPYVESRNKPLTSENCFHFNFPPIFNFGIFRYK